MKEFKPQLQVLYSRLKPNSKDLLARMEKRATQVESKIELVIKQESRRTYGTAVSGIVFHLNYIHLNHSQI